MLPDPEVDLMGWLKALGDDGWVTTAEAAEMLGVTPGHLCRLRREGRLHPHLCVKVSSRFILWTFQGLTAGLGPRPAVSTARMSNEE